MTDTDKAIQGAVAAAKDVVAILKGCSDYERRLRDLTPVSAHYNADAREIIIMLSVMNHDRR